MGSVSQDLFLSPLSLSLHPTVAMFLPRLPHLLSIIFLGPFYLPHTINCGHPPCETYTDDKAQCMNATKDLNNYCVEQKRTTCVAHCEAITDKTMRKWELVQCVEPS